MNNLDQTEYAGRSPSDKFAGFLQAVRKQHRSFAACVREQYHAIELAIADGVPLDALANGLSQTYGIHGSVHALKSALSRIRRMHDGDACRQWYDDVCREQAIAASAGAEPGISGHTMRRPIVAPSHQGGLPWGAPHYFPGVGQAAWERGVPFPTTAEQRKQRPYQHNGGQPLSYPQGQVNSVDGSAF